MSRLMVRFKKKIEEFREIEKQERLESRAIHKDSLRLYFDDKNRLRLYFKENELTKYCGFSVGILSDSVWYDSTDSVFEVKKISLEEIQITSKLYNLPLSQIWNIKITPKGNIIWDAGIELKEPLRIDNINARIFLSKLYSQWIIPLKRCEFPLKFDSDWHSIDLSNEKRDFIGLISFLEEFPSITLKNLQDSKALLAIENTDINLSSRVLEVQFEEEKELYQPGTYPYLKAIIQFYPDKSILEDILKEIKEQHQRVILKKQEQERKRQEEEQKRQEEEQKRQEEERLRKAHEEDQKLRTLQEGYFRLYFDQDNRIHIYYKDNELTKGPGLNTDIFSEGNWYASSDSQVKIERPSSDERIVYLIHNQIPLTQIWHLKLKPEGTLTWDVDIEVKESLRIDRRGAHLFLSKSYKNWIAPPIYGEFPAYFDRQWQRINSSGDDFEFIGVLSSLEELPSITLKNLQDSKALLAIENTDINLSSRVLEVQFEEEKELYQPGTYSYLKAIIQFYPDKSILEDIRRGIKERQEQERKRQEEELGKQEEKEAKEKEIEKVYVELKENIISITPGKERNMYIFGDNEELHDKVSFQAGDFKRTVSKIKIAKKDSINIRIGISRFNFFKLNAIAQFCSTLMNNRIDLRSLSLNFFPIKNLYFQFSEYIKELNARLGPKIRPYLKDEKLLDLLWTISSQADQYNEKDLLRLLGIIAENPFIGPQTIVLDTYHRCNANCIHCWIHTARRKRRTEHTNLKMGVRLYRKIIDDAADLLCDEIIIQGDGEPLLDSRFIDMTCYARNKGLKVLFFTNGILLDKKKTNKLMDLQIDEIFCSLPAGTEKTYAKINSMQSKDTFYKIVKNLKDFISLRKSLRRNKPWLQMTHVIHNLNYNELKEMAKIDAYIGADKVRFYLARLDKNISFLKLEPNHIEIIKRSLKSARTYLKENNIELQDNIYFQLKNYNPTNGNWSGSEFLKTGCSVGWFFSLILAKGEVSMCCHLRIIDYLKGRSFKEIWNSMHYNRFRVQAKYLIKNKNVTFLNGVKLYDEFCNHCDTHQVILRINKLLQAYNLDQFL